MSSRGDTTNASTQAIGSGYGSQEDLKVVAARFPSPRECQMSLFSGRKQEKWKCRRAPSARERAERRWWRSRDRLTRSDFEHKSICDLAVLFYARNVSFSVSRSVPLSASAVAVRSVIRAYSRTSCLPTSLIPTRRRPPTQVSLSVPVDVPLTICSSTSLRRRRTHTRIPRPYFAIHVSLWRPRPPTTDMSATPSAVKPRKSSFPYIFHTRLLRLRSFRSIHFRFSIRRLRRTSLKRQHLRFRLHRDWRRHSCRGLC